MNGKFGDNSIMDKFSTFYNIYNFLIHLALMTTLHAVWKAGYNKVHIMQNANASFISVDLLYDCICDVRRLDVEYC